MQLLLKSIDSSYSCIYAEIRTRIPEIVSWDYNFDFTVKSASLKETIDDLEWPGSSILISLQPNPPSVTFKGEGHGDLQIDMMYYSNTGFLRAFNCDRRVSHRYKYKFICATTSNIPSRVIRENRRSKLSIGRGGMLKVQHLFSVARPSVPHPHIGYIEFFVKPEIDEEAADN